MSDALTILQFGVLEALESSFDKSIERYVSQIFFSPLMYFRIYETNHESRAMNFQFFHPILSRRLCRLVYFINNDKNSRKILSSLFFSSGDVAHTFSLIFLIIFHADNLLSASESLCRACLNNKRAYLSGFSTVVSWKIYGAYITCANDYKGCGIRVYKHVENFLWRNVKRPIISRCLTF